VSENSGGIEKISDTLWDGVTRPWYEITRDAFAGVILRIQWRCICPASESYGHRVSPIG
jgi:hypothetical protein